MHDTIKYNDEEAFFRNTPKYNEIVDLTEDKPSIIINLTIKKHKRSNKRKTNNSNTNDNEGIPKSKNNKETDKRKKHKNAIVTGNIPIQIIKKDQLKGKASRNHNLLRKRCWWGFIPRVALGD